MEVERKEAALSDMEKLKEKSYILEEELLKKKEMTKEVTDKAAELGKANEESLRVARVLKNHTNCKDGKVMTLEKQLEQAVLMEKETEAKYEEIVKKLETAESKLDSVDNRAVNGEKEKTTLEEELKVLCCSLKSIECSKDKSFKKEESYTDKIKTLTARCNEIEGRAEVAEKAAGKLQDEVEKLEQIQEEFLVKNKKLEDEMEAVFQDLRNM